MKNKTIVERLRQFTENLDEGFDNYDFRMAAAGNFGASWEETALAIADAIEAEYLPRPRFNDGSVVQIGDKFVYPFCTSADDYDTDTVDEYRVGSDGWCLIIGDHGKYSINECLRRPEPGGDGEPVKIGDEVFDNVYGDEYVVDEILPLKPCPFCGGEAIMCSSSPSSFSDYESSAFVQCTGCGAKTHLFQEPQQVEDVRQTAANAWNRRA